MHVIIMTGLSVRIRAKEMWGGYVKGQLGVVFSSKTR